MFNYAENKKDNPLHFWSVNPYDTQHKTPGTVP